MRRRPSRVDAVARSACLRGIVRGGVPAGGRGRLRHHGCEALGPGQWFAEGVATFCLLLTIFGCVARTPAAVPYAVGLYITSAYWFTASTSFANPAVTIARAFSDTFAGIALSGVVAFIAAQLAGMLAAIIVGRWLWSAPQTD